MTRRVPTNAAAAPRRVPTSAAAALRVAAAVRAQGARGAPAPTAPPTGTTSGHYGYINPASMVEGVGLWDPRVSNQTFPISDGATLWQQPFQYNRGIGGLGGMGGRVTSSPVPSAGTPKTQWSEGQLYDYDGCAWQGAHAAIPGIHLSRLCELEGTTTVREVGSIEGFFGVKPHRKVERVNGVIVVQSPEVLGEIERNKHRYTFTGGSRTGGTADVYVELVHIPSQKKIAVPGHFAERVWPETGGIVEIHKTSALYEIEGEKQRAAWAKEFGESTDADYMRRMIKKHPIRMLGYAVDDVFDTGTGSGDSPSFWEQMMANGGPDVKGTLNTIKYGALGVLALLGVSLFVIPYIASRRAQGE